MTETAARPLIVCTGCGSTETLDQIRTRHPNALSCCPERRMVNTEGYDAGKREAERLAVACAVDALIRVVPGMPTDVARLWALDSWKRIQP